MFTNGEYQPHLNFTTSLSQNQLNAENQRLAASTELNAWKKELLMVTASSPAGDLDTALTNAKNHLNTIRTLTNAMMDALNSAVGVQQGTLDGYKATVTGARAALSGAISSVNGLQQTVNAQKLAVDQAASALALKKEGATPESIASQEAAVQQAAASVQNLEVQLGKTSIRAPFSGTVASIPVRVGELVLPGQTIVSIVNIKGLQVKAYVSEEDMPRIEEGADVVIGSDGTKGKVARIAPSVDSATRKIEVDVPITENGSTSPIVGTNVTISIAAKSLTNTAGPVYHLPLQAIKVTDGGGYVYTVSSDSLVEEHKVAIGSVSGEYVEVISGIDDGMKLVIPVYELKAGEKVAATVTSSN
jgi:RND family efflux transporter MFP subunit